MMRFAFRVLGLLALFGTAAPTTLAVPMAIPGAPSPPSASASRTPFDQKLTSGYDALNRGDVGQATTAFNEARKLDPKSALPFLGLAEAARRQNQVEVMEDWIKKAMAADPKSQDAVRAWGRLSFMRKKFPDAEAAFKRALALNAQEPAAHIDLAEYYLNGPKNFKMAESAYRDAIRLKPDHAGAHMGLASALAAQGQLAQAVAEYELAAKHESSSPLPMHMLGLLYLKHKKLAEALAALDRSIRIRPDYVPGLLDRGDVHMARNEPTKALTDYEAAAKAAPKLAIAKFKIGMIHQGQKKWAEAESAYLAAIEADPKMFGAYNNLAWMAAERRARLDDALKWINKAIEIAPQVLSHYDTLGWVHRARGELAPAAAALEKATASKPPQAEFHYRLATIYNEMGRRSEAVANFKRALQIKADFPEAAEARKQIEKLSG